jgi:hypothetical protein
MQVAIRAGQPATGGLRFSTRSHLRFATQSRTVVRWFTQSAPWSAKAALTLRSNMKEMPFAWLAMIGALMLIGCENGASGYIVAGNISGLSAGGLVLQNDGGDHLTVQMGASSFQFPTAVAPGGSYQVTVASQPTGLTCTVTHGAGADVQATVITNVTVACSAATYQVAGTISGLTASGLVLQNNGTGHLTVGAAATAFQFPTTIAAGGGYSVAVSAQPAGLTCTVSNGAGSKVSANIRVTCSPTALVLGGTVAGLNAAGLVLQDNGTDDLSIPANATNFRFATPIAYGSAYSVTMSAQPLGQSCSIADGASTATANVADIAVTCSSILTFTLTATSGANGSISPTGSQTVNRGAGPSFVATPNVGYGVYRWLLDGTLVQTGGDVYTISNVLANHSVQVTFAKTTLTPSLAALPLAVHDTAANAALTGNARQVIISNTGSVAATNVSISYPTWPSGTTASSTCGSALAPGATCSITVTPGPNATSACTGGIAPSPGVVAITSEESGTSSFTATVLGYACIYQGGNLFAIDDTTPSTAGVSGKVAALTDQAPAFPNGTGWNPNGDLFDIPGIYETSISPCAGNTSGACDTAQIAAHYSAFSPSLYAAGLCLGTIDDYADWYLPAICEMGFDGASGSGSGCGSSVSPLIQNMQSSLVGLSNFPAGYYWSSTEYSADPVGAAWVQAFTAGGSFQSYPGKDNLPGVRCVRALTQ